MTRWSVDDTRPANAHTISSPMWSPRLNGSRALFAAPAHAAATSNKVDGTTKKSKASAAAGGGVTNLGPRHGECWVLGQGTVCMRVRVREGWGLGYRWRGRSVWGLVRGRSRD
jgi:hypothetical protein